MNAGEVKMDAEDRFAWIDEYIDAIRPMSQHPEGTTFKTRKYTGVFLKKDLNPAPWHPRHLVIIYDKEHDYYSPVVYTEDGLWERTGTEGLDEQAKNLQITGIIE